MEPTVDPTGNAGFCFCEHSITISLSDQNLILCVFLFKTHLSQYGWFISVNSQPAILQVMPEGRSSYTPIFSVWHTPAFLQLGPVDGSSALCSGATLNSKITKEKHPKCENYGPKKTKKRTVVYCVLSGEGGVLHGSNIPWLGPHLQVNRKPLWVSILELQINFIKEANLQKQNL